VLSRVQAQYIERSQRADDERIVETIKAKLAATRPHHHFTTGLFMRTAVETLGMITRALSCVVADGNEQPYQSQR